MRKLKNLAYSSMCLSALLLATACNGNTSEKKAEAGQDSTSQEYNEQGFVSMLDQNSLSGWEGDSAIWSMKDGVLTGEIKPGAELKNNTFLIWKGGEPGDFVLRAKFKISDKGNSGINYRSERFTELRADETELSRYLQEGAEKADCVFRIAGRQPELWDAVSGVSGRAGARARVRPSAAARRGPLRTNWPSWPRT